MAGATGSTMSGMCVCERERVCVCAFVCASVHVCACVWAVVTIAGAMGGCDNSWSTEPVYTHVRVRYIQVIPWYEFVTCLMPHTLTAGATVSTMSGLCERETERERQGESAGVCLCVRVCACVSVCVCVCVWASVIYVSGR